MTDYQLFALGEIWPALLVPLLTSITYYSLSPESRFGRRMLDAAHGILLVFAFAYAVAVSPYSTYQNAQSWIWPFWMLLGLFVVAVVHTLLRFRGNHWIHVVQLLLLPSAFLLWLVGTMTITHDWL